jgi:hypothetical protein
MTTPQFQSMNDLTVYLEAQQQRITALESELQALKANPQPPDDNRTRAIVQAALPQTNLLSPSFMTRAFTVWGHYFVSQLIIGLGIGVVYLIIFLVTVVSVGR